MPTGSRTARRVADTVRAAIARPAGGLSFAAYMQLVLYAPGLGYYVAGARKFGAAGDFVTAPELTPLFAQSLAVQIDAIRERSNGDVLELGAGTGQLAADLLAGRCVPMHRRRGAIASSSRRPTCAIGSATTIAQRAGALASRVEWIDALPARIDGAVVMNEVLDAVPVHVVARRDGFVVRARRRRSGRHARAGDRERSAMARCAGTPRRAFPRKATTQSELNPAAEALVESLGRRLRRGAMLIIDYGFPQARVLPSAARSRHADGALPASRACRPAALAGAVRPDRARRFHRRSPKRAFARIWTSRDSRRRRLSCSAAASSTACATSVRPTSRDYLREASACRRCSRRPRWASCSK